MTPEQITKWANEVGMNTVMEWGYTRFASPAQLQHFAQLVRNETLEKVADMAAECDRRSSPQGIAAAIRILKYDQNHN